MSGVELYSGSYIGKEEEIFTALKDVKFGELMPEDSILAFFYDQITDPSTTLFLKSKKRVKFFYVDNDDFLSSIVEKTPEWVIDIDKNILRINLMYQVETELIPLIFNFDIARDEYKEAIRLITKKEEFELYYLSILYGGLVVEKRVKFKIPKSILKTFKKLK